MSLCRVTIQLKSHNQIILLVCLAPPSHQFAFGSVAIAFSNQFAFTIILSVFAEGVSNDLTGSCLGSCEKDCLWLQSAGDDDY